MDPARGGRGDTLGPDRPGPPGGPAGRRGAQHPRSRDHGNGPAARRDGRDRAPDGAGRRPGRPDRAPGDVQPGAHRPAAGQQRPPAWFRERQSHPGPAVADSGRGAARRRPAPLHRPHHRGVGGSGSRAGRDPAARLCDELRGVAGRHRGGRRRRPRTRRAAHREPVRLHPDQPDVPRTGQLVRGAGLGRSTPGERGAGL